MSFETIAAEVREGGIGILTLNRPDKRNALSVGLRREVIACLDAWRASEKVRAVVVTGAGKAFCAGFDLGDFAQPDLAREVFETSARYHRDLWAYPKVTIAAVNGAALGGGFDLATLCDVRLGSTLASFGHPEIKFGAPPLFTPLRWLVGDGRARELCLTGRRIDAAEALRIGLLTEVTEPDALLDRAIATAKTILEAPAAALAFTKKYLVDNAGKGFEDSFRVEHDAAFEDLLLRR